MCMVNVTNNNVKRKYYKNSCIFTDHLNNQISIFYLFDINKNYLFIFQIYNLIFLSIICIDLAINYKLMK